ncbi:MAG TPA: hypothetical protein VHN37_02185 [Actinomycetota bacterium]|nr:hypothetical protein [Actinomycetota bacterium]
MRRTVTILLVMGLVGAAMAVPADAAKKKKKKPAVRVVEATYSQPAIGIGGVAGACPAGACPTIATLTNETYAMIVIEDDVSPSGYVAFNYDPDGDGIQNPGSGPDVCGSTAEPVAMEPGTAYTAWPWAAGPACPGSASTSGTIKLLLGSDPAALQAAAAAL